MIKHYMRIMGIIGLIASMPLAILSDPTINLKNKSDESIQVQFNGGPLAVIGANESLEKDTDVKNIASIDIHYCPTKDYCKKYKPNTLETLFPFRDSKKYETMYLKFSIKNNGKGHLGPQEGKNNKTTDKYSLAKNIKSKDIKISRIRLNHTTTTDQEAISKEAKDAQTAKAAAKSLPEEAWKALPEGNKARTLALGMNRDKPYFNMPLYVWHRVLGVKTDVPTVSELRDAYAMLSDKWDPAKAPKDKRPLATEVMRIIDEAAWKLGITR